ncbi:elongation factor P maturation arginine rhamnosyltransferase EarP [Candidatus Dactylopiibacterium carminicum]|uniref:Protein-arginine rhamnosyltransferase n=1 Tax=Candidatus Dactylopiibacterium carminicum TaxID=857335 RepID=A0ABQ7HQZ3_9RHOO|nr:elongation factor P maturation arginine rhamnosyltransferase EarP [Candidatus Dactylopiibacterium carminicum]KAF7599551.1 elongation factor P maturation arginine rhamnosyltransferase EarP [Candidatus Dactylopiibacterium carminicum]PAS99554.1 MAG: hypothetical protein BSR46_07250 [Candidatus Dactylopiibacterium carminicum]
MLQSCDIFCRVIDNYGDIGVSWRLARQLVREHGLAVRLWVDQPAVFHLLAPALAPERRCQVLDGVEIRRWDAAAAQAVPADLVIEAFGAEPPPEYLAAMAGRQQRPLWVDVEYLSAEDWVEGCHAMPSPHPRLPLVRHFFYPGFTDRTGGLLREAGLCEALDEVRVQPAVFWRTLGLMPPAGALAVSLFSYENEGLGSLLTAWATGALPVFCAVTAGRHLPGVRAWLATQAVEEGGRVGNLTLAFLPFLPQADYDCLLAACDLNIVRGEDSFVRAQWAGRPLVWHIYRHEEGAHLLKLEAFLDRYMAGLDDGTGAALRAFWQAWEAEADLAGAWQRLQAALPALQHHAAHWRAVLAEKPDLASNLLIFSKNLLECPAL